MASVTRSTGTGHPHIPTTVPFRVPADLGDLTGSGNDVLREWDLGKPDPFMVNEGVVIIKFVNSICYILFKTEAHPPLRED
jgi:hypothetical protein